MRRFAPLRFGRGLCMRHLLRFDRAGLFLLFLLLGATGTAQLIPGGGSAGQSNTDLGNITEAYHQGGMLTVHVWGDDKQKLDRQSAVRLHCGNPEGTIWQTTKGDSETTFLGLSVGKYDIQASAVGFLTVHKEIEVSGLTDNLRVEVVLQRDPGAIDLDASGTADALMPPKVRKQTDRAFQDLKSGNLKDAQKRLHDAYNQAPSNSQVNFLLGYLAFQQNDFEKAEGYLAQTAVLDSRHAQALTLLGRVRLLRGEYVRAQSPLEQALIASPNSWMAHNLLADVFMKLGQYEKAREQAQFAVDKGSHAANAAQLVLAEALASLGRDQEGIQAIKTFLQYEPRNPSAPHARDLLAALERRADGPSASELIPKASAVPEKDPLLASSEPMLPTAPWQPPGVDDSRPAVAGDVTCPFDKVIGTSGERVEQLVDNVARFAAIEDLLHERLDNSGNPTTRETRKFDYAASISESRPGVLLVDEYRSEHYGLDNLPDQIMTKGFAALALVFHPSMRDNYQMNCEGLSQWHGQPTWLVHFRQRDDRPSRIQEYVIGKNSYPVKLKGRAWITADNFQIVRIESELVNPIAQARFFTEHQIAEYGPVAFEKKNLELWLPKTAEVYLDFAGHRYYRRHSFDHYMLFSVDSEQKVHEASQNPHGPGSTTPKKRRFWHA